MATVNELGINIRQREFFPCAADTVIAVGDFVYWDGTTVKAASAYTWVTSDAITNMQFKRYFAGVALDAHRTGDKACLLPVATCAEVDATLVSSSTVTFGQLFQIDGNGSSTLNDRVVEKVSDPSQAIGSALRSYTGNVSTVRILVESRLAGADAFSSSNKAQVLAIPITGIGPNATTANVITANAVNAYELFGGAVEILGVSMVVGKVATGDLTIQAIKNASTNLTALTVAASGGAIGKWTAQSQTSDSNRYFDANDKFGITVASGSNESAVTGLGVIYIRYRPLS